MDRRAFLGIASGTTASLTLHGAEFRPPARIVGIAAKRPVSLVDYVSLAAAGVRKVVLPPGHQLPTMGPEEVPLTLERCQSLSAFQEGLRSLDAVLADGRDGFNALPLHCLVDSSRHLVLLGPAWDSPGDFQILAETANSRRTAISLANLIGLELDEDRIPGNLNNAEILVTRVRCPDTAGSDAKSWHRDLFYVLHSLAAVHPLGLFRAAIGFRSARRDSRPGALEVCMFQFENAAFALRIAESEPMQSLSRHPSGSAPLRLVECSTTSLATRLQSALPLHDNQSFGGCGFEVARAFNAVLASVAGRGIEIYAP